MPVPHPTPATIVIHMPRIVSPHQPFQPSMNHGSVWVLKRTQSIPLALGNPAPTHSSKHTRYLHVYMLSMQLNIHAQWPQGPLPSPRPQGPRPQGPWPNGPGLHGPKPKGSGPRPKRPIGPGSIGPGAGAHGDRPLAGLITTKLRKCRPAPSTWNQIDISMN